MKYKALQKFCLKFLTCSNSYSYSIGEQEKSSCSLHPSTNDQGVFQIWVGLSSKHNLAGTVREKR